MCPYVRAEGAGDFVEVASIEERVRQAIDETQGYAVAGGGQGFEEKNALMMRHRIYATHSKSKVDRPIKQLEAFQRVSLIAGETKTVKLHLPAQALAYWETSEHKWVLEKDVIRLTGGNSSSDSNLAKIISVK